jgi:hypothetical protein
MPAPRKRIPQTKNSSLVERGPELSVPDRMSPTNAVRCRVSGSSRLRGFLTARRWINRKVDVMTATIAPTKMMAPKTAPPISFSGVIIAACHDDVCMHHGAAARVR